MTQKDQSKVLSNLGLLLQLQRRARQAEDPELPFILVNETRLLVPYRQAVLWLPGHDKTLKVAAVSGLANPDPHAPFVMWLKSLAKAMLRLSEHTSILPLDYNSLPDDLAKAWADWLPKAGIWLPLLAKGKLLGALALFRDDKFRPAEAELLSHLVESYAQSFTPKRGPDSLRFKIPHIKGKRFWIIAAICVAMLLPMRQTVLAPAEVTALHPSHIRAGLDGVIKNFYVAPNQKVSVGEKLLDLEDDHLRTKLVMAQKSLEMARAELQQAQQLSLADPRSKIRLPMLQGRVEQLTAEAALVESQISRVLIISPANGIAVLDDPDAWLGRPVSLGQKIMEVADPDKVQLEITLPMSETLPLQAGDSLLFFPNISPHAPLSGSLTVIGYQAAETPGAGLAFTLRASLEVKGSPPRLGLRGTAKLYGKRMPLIFLLLRRPMLQLRQWLGM